MYRKKMCKWDYDETREKRISEIYLNLIDIKWIKKLEEWMKNCVEKLFFDKTKTNNKIKQQE